MKFLIVILASMIMLSLQKEQLLATVDVCRFFPDGSQLRKPGTCNEGIICKNFTSTPGIVCPKWYSLETTTTSPCVSKKPTDAYCKSPCAKGSSNFVADKKSCRGWVKCRGTIEVSNGVCPAKQIFNQKRQSCSYDDSSKCIATYDLCDVVPKGIPFPDEDNCHKYYVCNNKGNLQSLTCAMGTYYDRATGNCSAKAGKADCYKHPYSDKVCGDKKVAYRNRFVSDATTCRGYFYCQDLGVGIPDPTPQWGQCPLNEFFNPIERACMPRAHVKCELDRCDGRIDGEREISSRKGCQHYFLCGNGHTLDEIYCGDGLYFDAENSICTPRKKSYIACS